MKTECIKFLKWVFEKRKIKLNFDVEDMWSDYEREQRPRNYGMVYLNFKIAEFYQIGAGWIRTRNRSRNQVEPRLMGYLIMRSYGHQNDAIAGFYNVTSSAVTRGIQSIERDIATKKVLGSIYTSIKKSLDK